MGNFVYIPIIALLCYTFLFLAFIAAKKNDIINAFLMILAALILWTGGSFCMRMQLWPSIKFWYDASILGLTLLPYAFFRFVYEFVGASGTFSKRLWLLLVIVTNAINISTGAFLRAPEVVFAGNGEVSFVYHTTWLVSVMFGVCAVIVLHMLFLLFKYSKTNDMTRKQFTPIISGIIILFIGHIIIMIPYFRGFPADILSGIFNAFFMFYALYKRRLFKLTLLVSRGSCYVIAAGLSFAIFFNLIRPLERFINVNFTIFADHIVLIIAFIFTIATFLIYYIMKRFIDRVFIREEIVQAENLKEFGFAVTRSLNVNEIMQELVDVIQKTISVKRVYICVLDVHSNCYEVAHSTSLLDVKSFRINKDNPIALWLANNNECLLMKDFRRTVDYKSMWETEKKQIADIDIECFVPLKDEDGMVGIVLLSGKEKGGHYSFNDISFLDSVNSIGSIAVKNSRLYEKAYLEARTDELTGLLNRKYFYEVIQTEYEKHKNNSLALVILNIDDFKLYNQLYGNKEGDIALQNIARIIQATVGNNGYVARYSGKEFAVILPLYDMLAAKNLAETIRKQILNMNKRESDYSLKMLTVSGGVCSIPYAANNVKQLIDNADMAIYNVKRNGKNAIMVYSAGEHHVTADEKELSEHKADIYSEYAPTIYALTAAIDTKDHYTFNHSKSVAYYATELAYAYGMNSDCVEIIREAALLHDIGKIGIPEQILNKPGKLTPEEYEIMKGHVENSIGIIRHLPSLDYVIPAVIHHHERYDGNGYPRRIAREDIPVSARILCIADSFDAMISMRSYKEPYSVATALKIIEEQAGLQFDPKLAFMFIELVNNGTIRIGEEEA
ncbi:HD domain-containing phosphohydrolase [Sinanaerobacter chloroacetimidivorans]|jgi:diguanylate cyclase (GGDEF)-like protein/putative nucleotidyltransferase with HDIG domain|uniref:Diguanylate cyclase n=1 Tax=Sinanaerobacter chloroacetimidivorans TaxID=2818044 RepID=A0A8J8B2L5_9FIRM|nr:HD domain-containing phosphohydrolase [Sinanaerobacter chloroacetimidivorans]MBR0598871.1 diguanylate cyclase [Sinanaerobacter chloroacetimidivorans]